MWFLPPLKSLSLTTFSSNQKPQTISSATYDREPVIVIKMMDASGATIDIAHIDKRCNVTKHLDRQARDKRRAARNGKPRPPRRKIQIHRTNPRDQPPGKNNGQNNTRTAGSCRPEAARAAKTIPIRHSSGNDPQKQVKAVRNQNPRHAPAYR
jgi:hypothetical protein